MTARPFNASVAGHAVSGTVRTVSRDDGSLWGRVWTFDTSCTSGARVTVDNLGRPDLFGWQVLAGGSSWSGSASSLWRAFPDAFAALERMAVPA